MRLPPEQIERFYAMWKPLLLFVNEKLRIVPEMLGADMAGPWDVNKVAQIRDAMWANDPLREEYIARNPAGLSADDLAIVASWQHRRAGTFTVFRQLKQHAIVIGDDDQVYGVLGLASTLEEVLPFLPCMAKMVLLPFEDRIIYDSLVVAYRVYLGGGIRANLNHVYKDAKERGDIITSLLPSTPPISPEEKEKDIGATNSKVLDAFRRYLYQSGLSTKVAERDLGNVAAFADRYLSKRPEPLSLRDFGAAEVSGYLSGDGTGLPAGEAQRRQVATGFKRFIRFLRDTDRMDYEDAEEVLAVLKHRD